MNQIITNPNFYLTIFFYKEFVTLLMNFFRCNFNTQCNHVHAVSIKVLAFYIKYRFFKFLYHYCKERGFSSKPFAKQYIIANLNK